MQTKSRPFRRGAVAAPAPKPLLDRIPLRLRQIGIAYLFLLPALAVMGTFQFYPMAHGFYLSLFDYSPLDPDTTFVGLANFRRLLEDSAFYLSLMNSFLYLLVVPAIIACSLGLAVLVEPNIPFVHFFRACYYIPVVTMMVVVALIWRFIFDTDRGLINQVLVSLNILSEGIPWLTSEAIALFTVMTVTLWKGLGYYMVLFIVGLKAIPNTLLEAARIDGAQPWQILLYIKVPLLLPTIALVSVLSSIAALQVFDEIFIMTGGRVGTSTLVFMIYETGIHDASMRMGYASAVGVVLFGIVLSFTIVLWKFLEWLTAKVY